MKVLSLGARQCLQYHSRDKKTRVTLSSLSIAITLCATCSFQIYFGGCSLSFDPIIVTLSSLSIAISFLRYMRFPNLLVWMFTELRQWRIDRLRARLSAFGSQHGCEPAGGELGGYPSLRPCPFGAPGI